MHEEIHLFCFLISCFAVLVTPSINTPESSSDFMTLISLVSSFEINKAHPFSAITPSSPLFFFFSNLFIAFEVKLLTNPGKLSLAKRIERSVITFLPKLPYILRRNPLH